MSGGTLSLSWGRYGGFYAIRRPICARVCLGFVAVTWIGVELDDLMRAYAAAVCGTDDGEPT